MLVQFRTPNRVDIHLYVMWVYKAAGAISAGDPCLVRHHTKTVLPTKKYEPLRVGLIGTALTSAKRGALVCVVQGHGEQGIRPVTRKGRVCSGV